MDQNRMEVLGSETEPWRVTLVDTGDETLTGGRLKRASKYIAGDELFCLTYGDGLADIDVAKSIAFHRAHGKLATMTAVQPTARWGALEMDGDTITAFREKPPGDSTWINGGFFVLSPKVVDTIAGDKMAWEREPLERLAAQGELKAYRHSGFWQPMDTLRDKVHLEDLWREGKAPWKTW
jgi:glucose-1-phosphate cytidylyltransferase